MFGSHGTMNEYEIMLFLRDLGDASLHSSNETAEKIIAIQKAVGIHHSCENCLKNIDRLRQKSRINNG